MPLLCLCPTRLSTDLTHTLRIHCEQDRKYTILPGRLWPCSTRQTQLLTGQARRPAHLHHGSPASVWAARVRGSLPSRRQAPRRASRTARLPAASVSYRFASVSYRLTLAMAHRHGSISELVLIRQLCRAGACSSKAFVSRHPDGPQSFVLARTD